MIKERLKSSVAPAAKKLDNLNKKLSANSIMLRTFLASIFFMIALGIFTTLLRYGGNFTKGFVIVFGITLVAFFLYNMLSYLSSITRLSMSDTPNFPMILFINTFLSFISQLLFFNITLSIIVRTIATIRSYGTAICEVRCAIVDFYYQSNIYNQISNLIWWVSLATILIFFIGTYLVWFRRK